MLPRRLVYPWSPHKNKKNYITLTCPKREEAATPNKGTPILIKILPIIGFSKSLTLNKGKDTAMHTFLLPEQTPISNA